MTAEDSELAMAIALSLEQAQSEVSLSQPDAWAVAAVARAFGMPTVPSSHAALEAVLGEQMRQLSTVQEQMRALTKAYMQVNFFVDRMHADRPIEGKK